VEHGGSVWHSKMEPRNDGGALGVLYIGRGGEVMGRGGRVMADGGFPLPSVSWSKKGEVESTGRPFDEGETKEWMARGAAVAALGVQGGRKAPG
jgi:hypothetical protein